MGRVGGVGRAGRNAPPLPTRPFHLLDQNVNCVICTPAPGRTAVGVLGGEAAGERLDRGALPVHRDHVVGRAGHLAGAPVVHPYRVGAGRGMRPGDVLVVLVVQRTPGVGVEVQLAVGRRGGIAVVDLFPARLDDVQVHVGRGIPRHAHLDIPAAHRDDLDGMDIEGAKRVRVADPVDQVEVVQGEVLRHAQEEVRRGDRVRQGDEVVVALALDVHDDPGEGGAPVHGDLGRTAVDDRAATGDRDGGTGALRRWRAVDRGDRAAVHRGEGRDDVLDRRKAGPVAVSTAAVEVEKRRGSHRRGCQPGCESPGSHGPSSSGWLRGSPRGQGRSAP